MKTTYDEINVNCANDEKITVHHIPYNQVNRGTDHLIVKYPYYGGEYDSDHDFNPRIGTMSEYDYLIVLHKQYGDGSVTGKVKNYDGFVIATFKADTSVCMEPSLTWGNEAKCIKPICLTKLTIMSEMSINHMESSFDEFMMMDDFKTLIRDMYNS